MTGYDSKTGGLSRNVEGSQGKVGYFRISDLVKSGRDKSVENGT